MIPEKVLNAVYEQLEPLLTEMAKYATSDKSVLMEFEAGSIRFTFK